MVAFGWCKRFALGVLGAAMLPVSLFAGVPTVSNEMVTDVTTVSFSVVWASSEPGTANLAVYRDETGLTPVTEAVVTPHPLLSGNSAIKTSAEDNGVMKVQVTGLEADTTYYFQTITTSKSTPDITYGPASAPFTAVTTEAETVRTYQDGGDILPFSNDIITEPCYLEDGVTPADGSLLIATVGGGHYSITAFVGDGVGSPYALIDLNNLFGRDSHQNIDLTSGENLTLTNFRGLAGNAVIIHTIPPDNSLAEVKPGDPGLMPGWNMVSLPMEPVNPQVAGIIEKLGDGIASIWAFDSENNNYLAWDPILGDWSDLSELHSVTGYWFVMNDEASLKIEGGFIDTETVQLNPGWNLVGSKSIHAIPIESALDAAGLSSFIESVWYYSPVDQRYYSYDPIFPEWSDLQYLEPGKSYWFVVGQACDDGGCRW
ncbi:MAG: hypothetical protein V2B19_23565 [Pseudomonadota bacterium]